MWIYVVKNGNRVSGLTHEQLKKELNSGKVHNIIYTIFIELDSIQAQINKINELKSKENYQVQ